MDMSRTFGEERKLCFIAASPRDTPSAAVPATGLNLADRLVAQYLAEAAQGDMSACFDLGVVYSTHSHPGACDLVEAHKWFNLAAVAGHEGAKTCRADIAGELTRAQIAEAQRRAREWIGANGWRAP